MIINMTPHAIVIISSSCVEFDSRKRSYNLVGDLVVTNEFPAVEGNIPRCTTTEVEKDTIDGVPIVTVEFGEVDNLPEKVEGTFLVVSALVANAARAKGRNDLLVPARMVRDSQGNIVGCLALAAG